VGEFEGGSVGGFTVGDFVGDVVIVVGDVDGASVSPGRVGLLVGAIKTVGARVGGVQGPSWSRLS
jgi:hypothetical protein